MLTGLVVVCALVVLVGVIALVIARRRPTPPVEPQVVQAVFTATAHKDVATAKAIEAAMARAVHECMAQGVDLNDTERVRAAMMAARARVVPR